MSHRSSSTPMSSNMKTPRHRTGQLPSRYQLFVKPSATKKRSVSPSEENSFMTTPSKDVPNKLLLSSWGLPQKVLERYWERGVRSMFEWQSECLSLPGVLTGANLVFSAPTSAGKTLIAELIALKCILETKKKVLMILPFVSVAHEKATYLQSIFEPQGVRVGGFMGNQSPAGGFSAVDIAICTIEKANSLVNRLLEERAVHELGAVIVDELHMIGDSHRGYLLELLLTKVLYIERVGKSFSLKIQVVGMSATLPNVDVLARWLGAELFCTDFRPTPLKEMLKIGSTLYDMNFKIVREFSNSEGIPGDEDDILLICREYITKGHSVLIFCPTKAWCEGLSTTLAEALGRFAQVDQQDEPRLLLNVPALIGVCEQLRRTQVGLDKVLEKTVPNGVAFHHAGLTFDEREIIEGAFRQAQVRILVTTTTLSSGVNLPARLVIVRTPLFQRKLVDILTYKQMSGRAGRKGVDEMGESILMCKASEKSKVMALFKSDPKPIRSCLCASKAAAHRAKGSKNEGGETFALKRALLEVIASGVAVTEQEVSLYSSCTLFFTELQLEVEAASRRKEARGSSQTAATPSMRDTLSEAMEFLLKNDFIASRSRRTAVSAPENGTTTTGGTGEELFATQLGAATVASALSPEEALVVFKELRRARKKFVLENELHIIYLVTPVYVQDQWPGLDWYRYLCIWERLPEDMKQVSDILGVQESFLAQAVQGILPERLESQRQVLHLHRRFFMALALHDLVHEVPITHVAGRYGATKGLLQTLQSAAGTFAGMVTVFCNRLGWTNLELLFSQFQSRLTFGVERVLCDLVAVSLLNGFRARVLYNSGYHTLAALAAANPVAIETCLRNAVPFKSYKVLEDGECREGKDSTSRTWCARLRKGLTESEAAVLIVSEAQAILSKQLSVPVSAWNNEKGPLISHGSNDNEGRLESVTVAQGEMVPVVSLGKGRKRTRASLKGRVSGPVQMSSPQGIQNGVAHSNEPSCGSASAAANTSLAVSASRLEAKKFKPSSEEDVIEDSLFMNVSHERLIENCLDLSPIAVQNSAKINEHTTPDCSIHPSMVFNGTLSFSLTELDPERVAGKPEPMTIPDSFQCTPGSFSFQTYAMIDAACVANGKDEEEDIKGKTNSNEMSRSIIHIADSASQICQGEGVEGEEKTGLLSPSQLDFKLTQFIQETPSNSTSYHPSGLRELSSLTSSQFSHSGLTVINVTSNRTLFDTFVSECMEQKGVAFSVAVTSVDRSEGIGSVIVRSAFSGIKTLPHLNQQVVGVAFCWGGMDVYYVSLCKEDSGCSSNCDDDDDDGGDDVRASRQSEGAIPLNVRVSALQKLFEENSWLDVTAYDMKKHAKFLSLCCRGTTPHSRASRDPVVASWMLDTDAREKTLHKMVLQYLPDQPLFTISGCEDTEEVPLSSVASNFSDPEMQASAESVLAFALSSKLESLLKADNLYDAYVRLEMPSLLVLAKIELNGIGFSPEECNKQKDLLQCRLVNLEREAYSLAGHTFSLTSSEDIASVLYLELGLPSGPDTSRKLRGQKGTRAVQRKMNANRAKYLSTAKEVLEKIKLVHPLPGLVLEWRRISSTLTKMVFPLLKCAMCNTMGRSRVYPTVQIHTATGRVAFSEPSIQMVPKEFKIGVEIAGPAGKASPLMSDSQYLEVEAQHLGDAEMSLGGMASPSSVSMRSVFRARKGGVFLAADYSQLELRILAHMSGDRKLQQFLNSDGDAFKMIAGEWLGIPASTVSSEERQNAKQVCYGMVYGIGPKALGEQLGISNNDASQFMETFRSKYPEMKRFIGQVVQDCREKGFVTTLLGRKRYLSGISSANVHAKSQAERQAINTTIQGSAADLVKTAMVNIDARVEKLHPHSTCLLPSSFGNAASNESDGQQFWAWLVLQLHDELIYEVAEKDLRLMATVVRQEMENALQLSVKFPVKLKTGHSWGDLKPLAI